MIQCFVAEEAIAVTQNYGVCKLTWELSGKDFLGSVSSPSLFWWPVIDPSSYFSELPYYLHIPNYRQMLSILLL